MVEAFATQATGAPWPPTWHSWTERGERRSGNGIACTLDRQPTRVIDSMVIGHECAPEHHGPFPACLFTACRRLAKHFNKAPTQPGPHKYIIFETLQENPLRFTHEGPEERPRAQRNAPCSIPSYWHWHLPEYCQENPLRFTHEGPYASYDYQAELHHRGTHMMIIMDGFRKSSHAGQQVFAACRRHDEHQEDMSCIVYNGFHMQIYQYEHFFSMCHAHFSSRRPNHIPHAHTCHVPCTSTLEGSWMQRTAEQGLTRPQCACRSAASLAWFWRRFVSFKRHMRYRLRTCVGCWWLFLTLLTWLPMYFSPSTCRHKPRSLQYSSSVQAGVAPLKTAPSRSRPKSGGCRLRHFGWIMFLLFIMGKAQPAAGARVAVGSATTAEVPIPGSTSHAIYGTKQSGDPLQFRPKFNIVQKRSFRRAIHRAEQKGHTQYRGQRLTLQHLLGLKQGTTPPPSTRTRTRSSTQGRTASDSTYTALSWNIGGLTNALLDELQLWLAEPEHQHIWIVTLQATRWTFDSEWSNRHWTFVHSGSPTQRGGGVLTMISSKLCQPTNIRSRVLSDGRRLHTRVPLAHNATALGILNVYQYVWSMYDEAAPQRQKRQRLLQRLEEAIQDMPQRNLCLCLGDFNVQLSHYANLVGMSTTLIDAGTQVAPDSDVLQDLLTSQQLVALNTWTGRRSQAYTYSSQQSRTQIDYILSRKAQTTRRMRQCQPVRSFPVAAWRTCGMHRPLQVVIDYIWRPPRIPPRFNNKIDIEKLKQDMQHSTPQYLSYQQALQQALAQVRDLNMSHINMHIKRISSQYYPTQTTSLKPYHEHHAVQDIIKTKWKYLAAMRKCAGTTVQQTFRFWLLLVRFRRTRTVANKLHELPDEKDTRPFFRRRRSMHPRTTCIKCSASSVGSPQSSATRRFKSMPRMDKSLAAMLKHWR